MAVLSAFPPGGVTTAPQEPSELQRLEDNLATSLKRMRDMLGIVETRLDRALGCDPQTGQTAGSPTPPIQSGSIASLRSVADGLTAFCSDLDAQVLRLQRLA